MCDLDPRFLPIPAFVWKGAAVTNEPSRKKWVRVPSEIAQKHMKRAVEEVIGGTLPADTTVDGSLYSGGGGVTLDSQEFPENPPHQTTVELPARK
jgi:hypothetical protein